MHLEKEDKRTLTGDQERTLLARESAELAYEQSRQANLRTFLSWNRTGMAIVGGGIAIMKLMVFTRAEEQFLARLSGSMLIILGISIFIFALYDSKHTQAKLPATNETRYSNTAVTVMTAALILITLLLFAASLHID